MKITSIKECGSSNILRWGINNGADVFNDVQLLSIINNETFYQLTIEDVNFLELFRLTQTYREKLHVTNVRKAEVPSTDELAKSFIGTYEADGETYTIADIVNHVCSMFFNIGLQMEADNDIIMSRFVQMFFPMLCRRFDVEVPLSFIDLIGAIDPKHREDKSIFNTDYPNNINEIIFNEEDPMILHMLTLYFIKTTSIVKYHEHYEELVKVTKYAPLRKSNNDNKLYKFAMLGFSRFNTITRGESRFEFFNAKDKAELGNVMKQMKSSRAPLKVEFAVQLPIHYMQLLENTYSTEEIDVKYESSMSSIIEAGIIHNNFIAPELLNDDDPDKMKEYENALDAYKIRINEANQSLLNSIPIIMNNGVDVDFTNTFAMLPSIYTTKAVITLNALYIDNYLNHFDPVLREMFEEMVENMKMIMKDL